MSARCSLSVAICTRNRAHSLGRTLSSLCEAALSAPGAKFEVLLVDNASDDATQQVADGFQDRLPLRIVMEPAVGLSRARNAALDHARGEWIAFTDDDAEVDRGWLAAIQEATAAHPRMDFFGGRSVVRWDGPPPAWLDDPNLPFIQGLLCHFDHGQADREIVDDAGLPFGVNMGMRRTLVDKVGRFRVDLGPGTPARGEETEFLSRARMQGFRGWYLPRVLVQHHVDIARLAPLALYRHGIAKGMGHARIAPGRAPRGSLARECIQLARAVGQALKGKYGWMRVCIVNAGLERGLRRARASITK